MEFEEQDEEIEMQLPQANYVSMASEAARRGGEYKYKECLKNHAVGIGGNAVDGCREFMAAGEEGTLDALRCAACNCHRNFHRKQLEGETMLALQQQRYYHRPSGYLVTPMSQYPRPLALPASLRELEMDEDMSNPSSSGGGGGSSKKRFRTKFTRDQKEKMIELAERLGWRIQQQDEATVQNFCAEIGIQRQVLKIWMHNNKHTLGKQLR